MNEITTKPDHQTSIGETSKGDSVTVSQGFQNFFDDLIQKLNVNFFGDSVILESYNVADVPDASKNLNGAIIVKDEVGGRTIATSNGSDWLRVSDGAIIS